MNPDLEKKLVAIRDRKLTDPTECRAVLTQAHAEWKQMAETYYGKGDRIREAIAAFVFTDPSFELEHLY
jgi:hypothetical protein